MKNKFKSGDFFHIFNKSIANFGIFNNLNNSQRFVETVDYYNNINLKNRFSIAKKNQKYVYKSLLLLKEESLVKFISYCIMPDHYHLVLKILHNNVLSKYISDLENSFTRYFNTRFKRKGPLWQSRFKAVKIRTNEQLLHVSRYVHLNPYTSNLIDKPEDWQFSSYRELITDKYFLKEMINEISINNPNAYRKFVENNKRYQRKLRNIKKLILE